MINATPVERSGSHGFALQAVSTACIGLQFGIMEAWRLHLGGFVLKAGAAAEVISGHIVVAVLLGMPFAILFLMPRWNVRGIARSFQIISPSLFVLFSMAATTVNVRDPRQVFNPVCLAWDLGILIGVMVVGWTWIRRPWGRRADAALTALILVIDGLIISLMLVPEGHAMPVDPSARARIADKRAPNVLFFLLDTLRADHLGIYGYPKPTSPSIDALALKGAVFDRAYVASNWTRPSVASIHTSTMPSRHRVIDVDVGLPSSLPLLAEQLSGLGYASGFFTMGVNISPDFGYGRGVEHFYVARSPAALGRTPIFRGLVLSIFPKLRSWLVRNDDSSHPGGLNKQVLAWARTLGRERPAFLYVHYMGPHSPYLPPEQFSTLFSDIPPQGRLANPPPQRAGSDALAPDDLKQMMAQYDAEILMHDFYLDRLLKELESLGWLENAVVVVTSDHGEGFGEHGVWNHSNGLFEEIVRVPLIIWSSLPWNEHRRLGVPVSALDLAPTLVDLAGGTSPEEWDGASLRPWLIGERQDTDRVVFQENPLWDELSLRNADWAYMEIGSGDNAQQWLYSSADSRQEVDLSSRHPETVQELHQLVRERSEFDSGRKVGAPKVQLDEEAKQKLKALGYLD